MTNRVDVYAMANNVNKALEKNGSNGRVSVGFSYGKVHVYSHVYSSDVEIDTIRGFLTKREAYDMLYAMLRMIAIVEDK